MARGHRRCLAPKTFVEAAAPAVTPQHPGKVARRRHLTKSAFDRLHQDARRLETKWRAEGCPLARSRGVIWLIEEALRVEDGEFRQRQKQERKARRREIPTVTPRQYARYRRQAGCEDDLRGPARSLAITRLCNLVWEADERNLYPIDQAPKRRKKKSDKQRRKRREWIDRSSDAEALVEQKAALTHAFKSKSSKEGTARGLCYALGEFLAPKVCEAYGLGEEHHVPMAIYLAYRASHFTVEETDMPGYVRWRAQSVAPVA